MEKLRQQFDQPSAVGILLHSSVLGLPLPHPGCPDLCFAGKKSTEKTGYCLNFPACPGGGREAAAPRRIQMASVKREVKGGKEATGGLPGGW